MDFNYILVVPWQTKLLLSSLETRLIGKIFHECFFFSSVFKAFRLFCVLKILTLVNYNAYMQIYLSRILIRLQSEAL